MMASNWSFTRRSFTRLGIAALFSAGRGTLSAASTALSWMTPGTAGGGSQRRYRADAQVILWTVSVVRRQRVGDGIAAWNEFHTSDGTKMSRLEFSGRSAPDRAAGLNRFGLIQEQVRHAAGPEGEANYFGLMTSSPEESAAEARKALHRNATEAAYSAIEGHITRDCIETAGVKFVASAETSPAEQSQLVEQAREALSAAPRKKDGHDSRGEAPRTFLHALATLLQDRGAQTRYTYNGTMYRLRVERAPDPKATALYRERRLIPPSATVTRVSGSLWPESGGKRTEFRLWIEHGVARPLPLRIEFQPRSYLRLTFEAEG